MIETTTAHVDVAVLQRLVVDGYLTCRPHPTADLVIWNYTPRCQFEHYWTDETLMCRGLITTSAGQIVARPFRKFFNLSEHQGDLPLESFEVTAKMDGSLGILYFLDGKPQIATRGSFTSEQAIKATQIFQDRYAHAIPSIHQLAEFTCLFEIIYPSNRIVVDYGEMEDLILLSMIHTQTGMALAIRNLPNDWPTPVVRHYDGIKDLSQLQSIREDNAEGFVIRFESGLRLKLKFTEYVRLHRLITQVNARVIWDLLRNNQPLDEMLERVPDEFYNWVKRTRDGLAAQFSQIESECKATVDLVQGLPTRKEQAAIITKCVYPGVTFAMLDHKNYQEAIWKLLYPDASRPFKIDEEG